jgi:hypothetical protein
VKQLLSARRRWYLLGAFWIVMLVLGIGGFMQQADEAGIHRSLLDTFYLTLQLITLDYGESSDLNWRLEIARFIAPLVAANTVAQTVSVAFRDEFARWRLRFLSDHTVILGLGATGTRIANAMADAGQVVVGIDKDPTAPGIHALRRRGLTALVADPTDSSVLPTLRLGVASDVVVACGQDATNVTIAHALRGTARATGRPALRCAVQLKDAELCELLRRGDLGAESSVRVDFFNLHERAARALLSANPPFAGERPPHLVILGLGQLGRSLVVAAAQAWATDDHTGPLRMTLIDRVASGRWEALRLQHPALPDVCAATVLDLDLDAPAPGMVERFESALTGEPTWLAVLFESEALSVSAALLARQTMRDATVPVIVRTAGASGIGELLTDTDDKTMPGYHVFPFLDRACPPDVVSGGLREQIARALHEDYLAGATASDYAKDWEHLSDEQRESSRRQADDLIDAFASIGCEIIPLRRWGAPQLTLTGEEVDALSEREHTRWLEERKRDGWTHGEVRDDALKKNPLLVEWAELDHLARINQRASIRALPLMLARSGFEPVRQRV